MEDIININEYVRTDNGIIGKYVKYRGIEDSIETNNKWIGFDIEKDIVKHSSNLIDIMEERRLCKWIYCKKNLFRWRNALYKIRRTNNRK